jgi:hypothetical protein
LNKEENLLILGCENGVMEIYEIEYDVSDSNSIILEKVGREVLGYSVDCLQ